METVVPFISPYLERPRRTLAEAQAEYELARAARRMSHLQGTPSARFCHPVLPSEILLQRQAQATGIELPKK
jgi:hypothetical protein